MTDYDIMHILVKSSISSLTYLNLSNNANQWINVEVFSQLLHFLKRQKHLGGFVFDLNGLTTDQTAALLAIIAESNTQLKELYLGHSCNFDSDESVQALAQCID